MLPETSKRPTKLIIEVKGKKPDPDPIEVQFNPNSYSIEKPVNYDPNPSALDVPLLKFRGGGSRTVTLNLFFDVTEHPTVKGKELKDVRDLTNRFVKLTQIQKDNKKRPPICTISWGPGATNGNSDFPFTGVVTQLTQEFTLFEEDGTPLRAKLKVSFREFQGWEEEVRKTDPEFTTQVVKRGDTLSSISATMYNDPTRWRLIADTNHLDDPRDLEIGRVLNIPKT